MATRAQQLAYFKMVKPLAYGMWKHFGVLPSVATAQGALESSWGTSTLAAKYNNFFGVKRLPGRKVVYMMTKEYNGSITIKEPFTVFDSPADSFREQGAMLNRRYKPALSMTTPAAMAAKINNLGYSTTSTSVYVGGIMSIINKWGLEEWDRDAKAGGDGGFSGDWSDYEGAGTNAVDLSKMFYTFSNKHIKKNQYKRPGDKMKGIQGIVIRDGGSRGSTAQAVRNYLDKGGDARKDGGFHILIDEKEAIGIVPLEEQVYHSTRSEEPLLPNPNTNTISIGLIPDKNGEFNDKLMARAIAVVSELAGRYGFPTRLIKRGYDIDGRYSPASWTDNQFLYSSFIGLVDYQKNQDTPLLNEELKKLLEEQLAGQQEAEGGGGSSSTQGKPTLVQDGTAKKVIDFAFSLIKLNMRYRMVPKPNFSPGGWCDCSSFTQHVFRNAAGINLPRTAAMQSSRGRRIPLSQTKPGDLIFFRNYRGGRLIIGHVGLITRNNADEMINSSVNFNKNTINVQKPRSPWWSIAWATRILSENDKAGTGELIGGTGGGVGTGGSGPGVPGSEIDPNKSYAIEVQKPINIYATDNNSSISIRKVGKGTTLKVRSVGVVSYRVGDGMWVKKSDKANYKLYSTGKASNPVGEARVKSPINVKSQPSHLAPNVIVSGAVKRYNTGESLKVYEVDNGMARISDPSATQFEEWVTISSLSYHNLLESYPEIGADDIGVYPEDGGGIGDLENPMNFFVKGFIESDITEGDREPVLKASAASNGKTLKIGSTVALKVPSNEMHSGMYNIDFIMRDLEDDEIAIFVPTNRDKVLLGRRVCQVEEG